VIRAKAGIHLIEDTHPQGARFPFLPFVPFFLKHSASRQIIPMFSNGLEGYWGYMGRRMSVVFCYTRRLARLLIAQMCSLYFAQSVPPPAAFHSFLSPAPWSR
jgi:hypothetical protein